MRRFATIAAVAGALLLPGCSDEPGASRALRAQGLSNIELLGYVFWGCGQDDLYHTRFRATNSQGEVVTGVVCGAPLKGSTVRFD